MNECNTLSSVADLTEKRRAAKRRDWLAHVRTNTPERRRVVRYRSGIVWRQNKEHIAYVLEAKAAREIDPPTQRT